MMLSICLALYILPTRALSPLPKSHLGQVVSDNSCVSSARAEMAEQEQLVIKNGKTNPAVWKYFGFNQSDVEQKKVQCRICYTVMSAPKANTTILFNHLKCNHKVEYDLMNTLPPQQTYGRRSIDLLYWYLLFLYYLFKCRYKCIIYFI